MRSSGMRTPWILLLVTPSLAAAGSADDGALKPCWRRLVEPSWPATASGRLAAPVPQTQDTERLAIAYMLVEADPQL
jgi:hypothetical protein